MLSAWPFTLRGTGALLLALVAFAVANEFALTELVYFGVLLLALLGTALLTLYVVRRSDGVTRALSPDVTSVGGESHVTVRVGVRAALPSAPGVWRDMLSSGLRGPAEGVFPALGSSLRGAERVIALEYDVTGVRRGVHRIGPLTVSSTDPFGLARRRHVLGERTTVTVAPTIVDLPALHDLPGAPGGTLHATTNRLGQGADNLIPRAYEPGDSMRRIHWRASAHRGQLMVRQEEQESTPNATVVLDLSVGRWTPPALRAPGLDAGFERGVSAAVSAVARLVRDGYTVSVIDGEGRSLSGEPIEGSDAAGVDAFAAHAATLTAVRGDHLGDLPALFAGATTGPVVLIVGTLSEADADTLAALAHHSALPLLLAVAPHADATLRARARGWRVAAIGGDTDLAAAWAAAVDRGVSHAFG